MTGFRNRLTELNRDAKHRVVDYLRKRYREPMVETPYRLSKTGVRPRK